MEEAGRRALLAVVICAAALLRLGGLDQGVRRGSAAGDEQHNFIEPIREMASRPTLDPGVRPGYPGLFNHLAFVPVVAGERLAGERGAYVGARALGAAFGIASVVLAYLMGRALAGPWAGLLAAALLALSRGEVVHAHFVTPDLVVISGILLVLLVLATRRPDPRTAAVVGALCGATVAVKYTGLVVLAAAAAGLWARRASPRAVVVAAAAALAAFALAAPFAVLGHSAEPGAGLLGAVRDYYSPTGYAAMAAQREGYSGPTMALEMAWGYVRQNVGLAGALLAAAAAVLFRPWRALAPTLAAVAAALAAILPARLVYPRHVLVPSALLALLAAGGARALSDRIPPRRARLRQPAMAALALLLLVPLAGPAFAVAAGFRRPDAMDQAAAWLERNVPGQPLVATSYPRFVLADRFEVRHWTPPGEVPLADVPADALRHYDLAAAPRGELDALAAQGLAWRAVRAFGEGPDAAAIGFADPPVLASVVPASVEASDDAASAAKVWSGSASWRTARGDGWIAGAWERARPIARVDLVADPASAFAPQGVVLEGRSADGRWRRLRTWALRPRTASQQDPRTAHGQVFVLVPPVDLVGLRVVGRGSAPWGLARIAVGAEPRDGEPASPVRVFWPPGP